MKYFANLHHEIAYTSKDNSICTLTFDFTSPIIHDYLAALVTFTNHPKLKNN